MKGRTKQAALLGLLAGLLVLLLVRARPAAESPSSPRRAADASGGDRSKFGKTNEPKITAEDVPEIDFARPPIRPSVEVASRDLFKFREPPPPPPPQPPPVTFQFTGWFGRPKDPVAVIIDGDQMIVVRAGDVLQNKFIIRHVGYESLDVGFVGFPDDRIERLPVTPAKGK